MTNEKAKLKDEITLRLYPKEKQELVKKSRMKRLRDFLKRMWSYM